MTQPIKKAIDQTLGEDALFQERHKQAIRNRVNRASTPQKKRRRQWHLIPALVLVMIALAAYALMQLPPEKAPAQPDELADPSTLPEVPFVSPDEDDFLIEWGSDNMDLGRHDYITINKAPLVIEPDTSTLQVGDVVYYTAPQVGENAPFMNIGRIGALPGSTVEIRDGQVYVNDEELNTFYGQARSLGLTEEEYFERVDANNVNEESMRDYFATSMEKVTIPPAHFFILTDMWWRGYDSKELGPIHGEALIGKVKGYAEEVSPVDKDRLLLQIGAGEQYYINDLTLGDKKKDVLRVLGSEFEQRIPSSGTGEILVYGNHEITLFDHTIIEMTLTVKQKEADEIFGGGLGQGRYYQSAEGRAFYSKAASQALVENDLGDDVELILKRVGEGFLEEGSFEKVVVE